MDTQPSCEYCGRCLSVCPSYRHSLVETMGPRARIDLVRAVAEGTLVPGERYEQSLKSCLQCLACTEVCGKGVDGAQVILDGRLAHAGKMTAKRRLERFAVCTLLPRRTLLRRSVKMLSVLQKAFMADTSGTLRHLPDAFGSFIGKRSLPEMAKKTAFEQMPKKSQPRAGVPYRGEVALFTGCFSGIVRPEPVLRLAAALADRGWGVYLPEEQVCCGAPAQLSGFGEEFEEIQSRNAEVFAAYGDIPVLTMCATCHRTLTREYRGKGAELAKRVMDAALFLQLHDEKTGYASPVPPMPAAVLRARHGRPVTAEDPLVVAVHDPCHLRLDPQVMQAVRDHLAARPWIRLTELSERGVCCGGGGVSSLKNPALADELGAARARAVIGSGAEVVVSQCPGCVTQLSNHLSRMGTPVRACHAMELIGM